MIGLTMSVLRLTAWELIMMHRKEKEPNTQESRCMLIELRHKLHNNVTWMSSAIGQSSSVEVL